MEPSGNRVAPEGWPAAGFAAGESPAAPALWLTLTAEPTTPPPLMVIQHGGGGRAPRGTGVVLQAALPQLAGPPLAEHWYASGAQRSGARGLLQWAATDDLLAGGIELPAGDGAALEAATCAAYREVLAATVDLGFPHLLRLWNVVPHINRLDGDLERYRRFCRGRAEAFEGQHGPLFQSRLCASSAVGSVEGNLTVWFLAARARGLSRENPRQVSAYSYPPCYGPRSPSFARATRCPPEVGPWILLSGTASIVGHASLHPGDVLGQLDETLRNLAELVPGAETPSYRALKVYLRRAADQPAVQAAIESRLGGDVALLFLRADVCREELLLEIEGVA